VSNANLKNQIITMTKTNSRGFNRSQVPSSNINTSSVPREPEQPAQMQNNNIGVVQNFNQYHIELKNVAPG
jgi:hypothetical protein